jgi:hypothetical protein
MASNRLKGHAFRWFGWRFGLLVSICECGAISGDLGNGKMEECAARGVAWHRNHKDEERAKIAEEANRG